MEDERESADTERPRIGISKCLLGEPVRYDGGHKRDRFLTDTLGQFVDWVAVCPEVGCGLPTPRESMHLEGDPSSPRLVTTRTHLDQTERMLGWAGKRLKELAKDDLCGFVFKTNSPSSGMRGIRVYDVNGVPRKVGVGLFARAFMQHFPLLPVEDEGRLHDASIRENFIERVFALKRYRSFLASDGSLGGLVDFHTNHKMQLMAHSQRHLSEMGKLVAHAAGRPMSLVLGRYEELLLEALALKATVRKNANVLFHMFGYFKKQLSADEKEEMLEIIGRYRAELVPLIVPVILMQHYVRKYDEPYLKQQTYLNAHPMELRLRNHA
jgi:uncharacterized protein YbgA (DUF1722 family)/uncharacterized protein YbbK (DUF523 family)